MSKQENKQNVGDQTEARKVDKLNPLYIDYSPAVLDNIEITDGQIYARGDVTATIKILKKTN